MENTAILICLFILLMGTEAQAAKKDLSYQERRARAKKIQPELQALVDQFEARTFDDGKGESIPYRLFKPVTYETNKKYPLVVYFYGSGGRGRDNRKQISRGSLYGSRI
jgi:predicted peptidase